MKKFLVTTALGTALLSAQAAQAETFKLGVMATLEGTYTVLGEDGVRGIKTALAAFGGKVAGKDIELVIQSTDAPPTARCAPRASLWSRTDCL